MNISYTLVTTSAIAPTYAHTADAGMDLFADETIVIEPQSRVVVRTGVSMAIPDGFVGLVWDKSGLAVNNGLTTLAGVIDASYRGEIGCVIYNTDSEAYTVQAGHKIAQLLIQPIVQATLQEVSTLPTTTRGEGRYGSTGLTPNK